MVINTAVDFSKRGDSRRKDEEAGMAPQNGAPAKKHPPVADINSQL
ncbi:hypothetical protein JMA_15260 [Jeotgalibacillus malaysiensis]|uniref:Uncharacterized protein n=1 Tax=Jeotgalibacillus malaysiensis TaxID=1508404 RepID=A0A0B5AQR2_9BACL|nr:hypothetical protein JMA_15260 [Jeotgalibacillus malaysiensis]